jgi:hypothetical protein
MVTSENGNIHTYNICAVYITYMYMYIQNRWEETRCSWIGWWRYCNFSAYFVFIYWSFFCWAWTRFLATTCNFCMFIFTIRCCICLHIMTFIVYCSWKDMFAIYMHSLQICSTWKTRDGPKCVKNFGVLEVSGLNK